MEDPILRESGGKIIRKLLLYFSSVESTLDMEPFTWINKLIDPYMPSDFEINVKHNFYCVVAKYKTTACFLWHLLRRIKEHNLYLLQERLDSEFTLKEEQTLLKSDPTTVFKKCEHIIIEIENYERDVKKTHVAIKKVWTVDSFLEYFSY